MGSFPPMKNEEELLASAYTRMTQDLRSKIANAEYRGKPSPIHHKQTVTNRELIDIFEQLVGGTFVVDELKVALEGKIRVNTDNPRSSVISSSYLKRLKKITGATWHQRRELGEEGKKLVKFYTEPEFAPGEFFGTGETNYRR